MLIILYWNQSKARKQHQFKQLDHDINFHINVLGNFFLTYVLAEMKCVNPKKNNITCYLSWISPMHATYTMISFSSLNQGQSIGGGSRRLYRWIVRKQSKVGTMASIASIEKSEDVQVCYSAKKSERIKLPQSWYSFFQREILIWNSQINYIN